MVDILICAQKHTGTQQLLSCCPKTIPKHQFSHHLDTSTSGSHSAGGSHGMPGGTWKSTAHWWHGKRGAFHQHSQGGCGDILAHDVDKYKMERRTGGL